MATFKAPKYIGFISPRGYWIAVGQNIGEPGWHVRIMNFATWKHTRYLYDDEIHATLYANLWRY